MKVKVESMADTLRNWRQTKQKVLKAEVVQKTFCVPVPMDAFQKFLLEDSDFDGLSFISRLEKLGAFDIDWSGHFGSNVFFSLNEDDFDKEDEIVAEIARSLEVE